MLLAQKDSVVLYFPHASDDEIETIISDLGATEIGITDFLKIRLWEAPSPFVFDNVLNTSNNNDIAIQGFTTGQANTLGGGYKLPQQSNSSSVPLTAKCDILQEGQTQLGTYATKVAIIDSGVDMSDTEPFYSQFLPTDMMEFNFTNNSNPMPIDINGHGNQMLSIIGNILHDGMHANANIQLLPYKVVGSNGFASRWSILQSIDEAIRADVDIINFSLGYEGNDEDDEGLMEYALATAAEQGILIVAAAGNDNRLINADNKYYPASLNVPNMIVVGAFECSEARSRVTLERAPYSNYGKAVDIFAIGAHECQNLKGKQITAEGTSHATAAITAVAAQLKTEGATNSQIKCAILNSVKESTPNSGGGSTLNNQGGSIPSDISFDFFKKIADAVEELENCGANIAGTTAFSSAQQSTIITDGKVRVSPNPFSDELTINIENIKAKNAKLWLTNQLGQLMYETNFLLEEGKTSYTLNKENLPSGIYFLNLAYGKQINTKKIVKH